MRREIQNGVKGRASAMSVALDKRDKATLQHCQRVAGLSVDLGRRCGVSARELRLLHVAAAFHDVGKVSIPDTVLKKTGQLTDADWAVIRSHCERGQRMLLEAGLKEAEALGLAVRHHHERFDGAGYPDGLAGEAIPFMARIIAIADAYDAMATPRIYGRIRPHAEIVAVLRDERGRQHDPYLSDRFLDVIDASPFRGSAALESAS